MLAVLGLLGTQEASAEVSQFQFGGGGGQAWADWTETSIVADVEAAPGSVQPLELDPDVNILSVIGPWERWKKPRAVWWRPGLPRLWRGRTDGAVDMAIDWNPLVLMDEDPTTGFAVGGGTFMAYKHIHEFYTLDFGAQLPVERWRFYADPNGVDAQTGEPFSPRYALLNFEITGGRDEADLAKLLAEPVSLGFTSYDPLDILLARVENNFEFFTEVRFPLQYLRLIRHRPLAEDLDCGTRPLGGERTCFDWVSTYGIAEFELYGRGLVPKASWESLAIDMGEIVNVGPVQFGISQWRLQGEDLVEAPDAPVRARIELKTGLDDTPTAYYTYNQVGQFVEATEDDYANKLKQRLYFFHPEGPGWRGPVVDDAENWSGWSAPLDRSGEQPRLPRGRYLKVRVRLETETLWDFARVDSVVVSTGPILAERVAGEVAVAGDLHPAGNVAQLPVGEPTELVYDIKAEFTAATQSGFDAVRFLTPSKGQSIELKMGEPLAPAVPDSVVEEDLGFALYLPRPIVADGDQRLRVRLVTTLYDAAGEMGAEAFERAGDSLPQQVDPGDVSDEVGTNQLRVLAVASTLGKVLGRVDVQPRAMTPQGDGVNDLTQVAYTLFSVREAQVEIGVYGLDGRQVRQLYAGSQSAGAHVQPWDGRDDQAQLVSPGLYLVRVEVDADEAKFARLHPVAVAY